MDALVRRILASYPAWWRRRYGHETAELTEDLLDESGGHRWRIVGSLCFGALVAWCQVGRRTRVEPVAGPNPWGDVPDGGHCDLFWNRGLSSLSSGELDPDEALLGVFDARTGRCALAVAPSAYALMTVASLGTFLFFSLADGVRFQTAYVTYSALPAVLAVAAWIAARGTSSRPVTVAVTSRGLAVFAAGALTGRSGRLLERLPSAWPELVERRSIWRRVRLGDRLFWVNYRSDRLLQWTTLSLQTAVHRPGAA